MAPTIIRWEASMLNRSLLRKQLIKAWQNTVEKHYKKQNINSERGLQVHFCDELKKIFDVDQRMKRRRLFIEPNLRTNTSESRFPDIVICDSKKVIGVIELKYAPRARPDFTKDIETLEFAALNVAELAIQNERFLGVHKDTKSYPLANDAVLCWAGIYKGMREDLTSRISKSVQEHFLQMDALTIDGADPIVYPFDRSI